jgi:hypothetical protein
MLGKLRINTHLLHSIPFAIQLRATKLLTKLHILALAGISVTKVLCISSFLASTTKNMCLCRNEEDKCVSLEKEKNMEKRNLKPRDHNHVQHGVNI